MTLVELAQISLSEDFPQVLFFVGQRFVFGEEVQDRLAARENVEAHLKHLLLFDLIERYCLLLPNLFCSNPVDHVEVEIEVEVIVVAVFNGEYLLLTIPKAYAIKLFFVELPFLAKGFPFLVVIVLPQLFKS